MKKKKKIPVFLHIPKNAGTYVLSWTMIMFRWYGIEHGWNNKVEWNMNLRRILLQHENTQIATVFVYDPKNIREHNKHFISHETDPYCNIVELSSFLKEIKNNSFTVFSIVVEARGIKFISNGLYEKICKTESATPLYYCLLRHPYDRAESVFNYLTSSNSAHEPTFNDIKSKTFQEYARSFELEDSWLIRTVVAISDNQPIDDEIFNQACSVLDRVRFSDVNNVNILFDHIFSESYDINQKAIPDEWVDINTNSSKIPKTKFSELDKTTKIAFLARTKFDRKLYKRFTKNLI